MKCICRTCNKIYNSEYSRAEYRGFCSMRCQHGKAKELGFQGQKKMSITEYRILKNANEIGDKVA